MENSKRTLRKLKEDYKDHQFYTYLTDREGFNYTLILASLLQVVHCTKFIFGQPKLIAYMSKRMPEAAKNYSNQNWKCVAW